MYGNEKVHMHLYKKKCMYYKDYSSIYVQCTVFILFQEIAHGKWLSLNNIMYKDPHGKER